MGGIIIYRKLFLFDRILPDIKSDEVKNVKGTSLLTAVFLHICVNAQENCYAGAFLKCERMLSGESEPNFQEAVFAVESAYSDEYNFDWQNGY